MDGPILDAVDADPLWIITDQTTPGQTGRSTVKGVTEPGVLMTCAWERFGSAISDQSILPISSPSKRNSKSRCQLALEF